MKPYQFSEIIFSCSALPWRALSCTTVLNSTIQHVSLLPSNIPSGFVVYPMVYGFIKKYNER
jgi:hypothetical protein